MKQIEQATIFGEFVDVAAKNEIKKGDVRPRKIDHSKKFLIKSIAWHKQEIKRCHEEIFALENGMCLGSEAKIRSHSKEYFSKKIGLIQKKIKKHELIIKDYEAELLQKD